MIFESDLRAFLLTVPEITAIVGEKIYGIVRPQSFRPLPEILIFRTHTQRQVKFCNTDKLVNADFQLDAYGDEGVQVFALARVLRHALVDFKGTMGATWVDLVTMTNEFPLNDPDPGIIRVAQFYNVWYQED